MRKAFYHGQHYWESEKSVVIHMEHVGLSYYAKGGKLQASILYSDKETGEKRSGKTVTVDEEDVRLHPEAGELLARALEAWR